MTNRIIDDRKAIKAVTMMTNWMIGFYLSWADATYWIRFTKAMTTCDRISGNIRILYHAVINTDWDFLYRKRHSHDPDALGWTYDISRSSYLRISRLTNSRKMLPSWSHCKFIPCSWKRTMSLAPQRIITASPALATTVSATEVTVTALRPTTLSSPLDSRARNTHSPEWCGAQLKRNKSSWCTSTLIRFAIGDKIENTETGGATCLVSFSTYL